MVDRDDDRATEPLPRPTPRQLVIRAIGTLLVVAVLVAAAIVVLDQRSEPADSADFAEAPRTVSYGKLSLQIPSDWSLNDLDDCGHPQADTLILGNAGVVTCDEGEREQGVTDLAMSSLSGQVVAPSPQVPLSPVTLPSGLRAQKGAVRVAPAEGTDEDADDDEPRVRTTVLEIEALDAKVVVTSPDEDLVNEILATAKQVPSTSSTTGTVAYLTAAMNVPRTWTVNDVVCGVPESNTVIAGHPGRPKLTAPPDGDCPTERPTGITDIFLESATSDFGKRWGVLARESVTLLGGIKAVRGTRALPDGMTLTVVVVPDLRAIAVARSPDQGLVDNVLSTLHRAVPPAPDEEQTLPSPSPDTTPRATLPAGVETKAVRADGIVLDVPADWTRNDVRCDEPQSDTVVLGGPAVTDPRCIAGRAPDVSDIIIDRLYGAYGSLWQSAVQEPFTLESGLYALRGQLEGPDGLPTTVLAFPQLDAIIVATAADDGEANELIDGILATTRVPATQPQPR